MQIKRENIAIELLQRINKGRGGNVDRNVFRDNEQMKEWVKRLTIESIVRIFNMKFDKTIDKIQR